MSHHPGVVDGVRQASAGGRIEVLVGRHQRQVRRRPQLQWPLTFQTGHHGRHTSCHASIHEFVVGVDQRHARQVRVGGGLQGPIQQQSTTTTSVGSRATVSSRSIPGPASVKTASDWYKPVIPG